MQNHNLKSPTPSLINAIFCLVDISICVFFYLYPAMMGLNLLTGVIGCLYIVRNFYASSDTQYAKWLNISGYYSGKLPVYLALVCLYCLCSTLGPVTAGLLQAFIESLNQVACRFSDCYTLPH